MKGETPGLDDIVNIDYNFEFVLYYLRFHWKQQD